jgi:hypothetical protein
VHDLEGVLGPSVIAFVERHVRTLLAWDILVFFHRNPDSELDVSSLAARLGRRPEEIEPEVHQMCGEGILACSEGVVRYAPTPEKAGQVTEFVESCQDRDHRLALIALVLHSIGMTVDDQ